VIRQGELYWISLGRPDGSGPGYRRPCLVIQNNLFNRSRISTVVICLLTSNLARAQAPGNVLLRKGEGKLDKRSVVNVSQIFTVGRSRLGPKIGVLSPRRLRQVLDGIALVLEPRDVDAANR